MGILVPKYIRTYLGWKRTIGTYTKKPSYFVDTRKGYVALATYGRVALILRTNRVIECDQVIKFSAE